MFPFSKKKQPTAALPPAATIPATPIPPVAVVAPAPPPQPSRTTASVSNYEPRDATFYPRARALFSAALQPAGYYPSDREQAGKTGDILARLLDSGEVPKGYNIAGRVVFRAKKDDRRNVGGDGVLETIPMLDLATQRDALAAVRAGDRGGQNRGFPVMTAAQMKDAETRLEWAGGINGIPTREEAEKAASLAGETFSELSEGVRDAALMMSWGRILYRQDITGAPDRVQDAIDIVVAEIDRAKSIFQECGQPVSALRSDEEANAQGGAAFPYPMSIAVDLMRMGFGEIPDVSSLEDRVSDLEKKNWAGEKGDSATEDSADGD